MSRPAAEATALGGDGVNLLRIPIRVIVWFVVIYSALSCDDAPKPAPPPPRPVGKQLPVLTRWPVVLIDELAPEAVRHLAVSEDGSFAYPPGFRSEEPFVRWIDTSGRSVAEIGRKGHGPGELVGVDYLQFGSGQLYVVDYEQARVVRFDATGRPERTEAIWPAGRVLRLQGDSIDFFVPAGRDAGSIVRARLGDRSGGRTLLAARDTFLQAVLRRRGEYAREGPPYAANGRQIVIADPLSYELVYYTADGQRGPATSRRIPYRRHTERELAHQRSALERLTRGGFRGPGGQRLTLPSAKQRLDTLENEVLPHFGRRGLQFDAGGRLWVIGEANDSTFVDVFADTSFLGRQTLPCTGFRRALSMKGGWLGLICDTPESADGLPEVQLYRVTFDETGQ